MAHQQGTSRQESVALVHFNDEEARTVEALAERIIPGDGDNAGATDAGVVYYIDQAIAGFSTDLQTVYRRGLRELDALCRREHGAPFTDLDADTQDDVVRRHLGPEILPADSLQFGPSDQPGGAVLLRFFAVVREHTVEGFFCDPAYGGNRGAVGWKLVGFPGAHWGYTAEQMGPGVDARSIPIKTLSDLRSELPSLPPNENFTRNEPKTEC
ncbi:gluconate 2-dehydrogenase subunit 3 family protein [Pseudonocardia nantongensis]|uniref:gluconate 2-dehydrogenase subunit 3 family protein n=1 Tax=Pseudonocardia nantongensis TaxID=1181885 RepID=UPI00397DEF98